MFFKRFVVLVICLAFFTRFFGLTWGDGNFFHPDERNMAMAVSQLSPQNYNPHFFAYGQFPLYLSYFSLKVVNLPNNFNNSVYILRFWSAIFSLLSILLVYLISKKLFTPGQSLMIVLLTIFSPGLIQLAHFGTTESLLVLIFLINIFLSIKIFQQPQNILFYLLAGIINGIGLATKISSLIFIGPILLVSMMNFIQSNKRLSFLPKILILLFFTASFYTILSPYNFIESGDFRSSLNYETNVALGQTKVFYTTQFYKSIPYLFQLTKVFPYAAGIYQYIFSIFGLLLLIKNSRVKNKTYVFWFLILVPSFVYFLYFGQLYVKWTRFVSPLFFLFPLLTTVFISAIKNRRWRYFTAVLCCLPGIYFMNLYLRPDIRQTASQWIDGYIPQNSKILSESGNVVNLPLDSSPYQVDNYDFYSHYDPKTLATGLANSEYILIPSRRVFMNYDISYYKHLFNGSLGYTEIKRFNPQVEIFLNPENAEETWSVFDHPTIRIYQKIKQLDESQYENLLKS